MSCGCGNQLGISQPCSKGKQCGGGGSCDRRCYVGKPIKFCCPNDCCATNCCGGQRDKPKKVKRLWQTMWWNGNCTTGGCRPMGSRNPASFPPP